MKDQAKAVRKPTQTDYVKTALRLPPDLHTQLHESTVESGRSLNAEIVARLEASFRRSVDDDQVIEVVEKIRGRVDQLRQEVQIAQAGAYTSSSLVADLIEQMYGSNPPDALSRLRDSSLRVANVYKDAVAAIEDESLKPVRLLVGQDETDVRPKRRKK